jgi:hypothetical protein
MEKQPLIEWKQKNNVVYFMYKEREIYFRMPEDYDLSKTHPDLLKLCEYMMFSPWHEVLGDYKFTRKCGENLALSFSTGVDSTANMIMLPENTPLIYVEREKINSGKMKQDNAIRFIENLDRPVIRIKTNFELIRKLNGLRVGYSTPMGMGVPMVLLADYLNLKYISYGKVFEDQFFPEGVFRDYTKEFMNYQKIFSDAGLIGIYPTVGCSEIITTKIVENSKDAKYSISCLRGTDGKPCNKCFKCFRKGLLRGLNIKPTAEIMKSINKNPPKMAPSLLYICQKNNRRFKNLKHCWNNNVSMLDKYYSPAYKIYNDEDQKFIKEMLNNQGISSMSVDEEEKLKSLVFIKPQGL